MRALSHRPDDKQGQQVYKPVCARLHFTPSRDKMMSLLLLAVFSICLPVLAVSQQTQYHPCATVRCSNTTECKLVEMRCNQNRCPFQARCLPKEKPKRPCPDGIQVVRFWLSVNTCQTDSSCPLNMSCNGNAQCCWKPYVTPTTFPEDKCKWPCRLGVCRLGETTSCKKPPCPLQRVCVSSSTVSSGQQCPKGNGSPVLDTNNKEIFCGRGFNRRSCPLNTTCNIDPLDRFAVCCLSNVSVIIKPGTCPKPAGLGICVDRCTHDNSCPGDQKCCSNGCGHTCISPIKNTTVTSNPCQNIRCHPTDECRLRRVLCVSSSCPPKPTCELRSAVQTRGTCPVGKPVLEMGSSQQIFCTRDSTCPDNTTCDRRQSICCWKNQTKHTIIPKPGSCPRVIGGGICITECNNDSSCSGDMKCCSNGCGRVCMKPVKNVTSTKDPCATMKNRCPFGQECRLEQVFCKSPPCLPQPVCKVTFLVENRGRCPVGKPVLRSRSDSQIFCTRTSSCPDRTSCDRRQAVCCWTNTSRTTNATKFGSCPGRFGVGPCRQECNADSHCRGSMKCCDTGCGKTCQEPIIVEPPPPPPPTRSGYCPRDFILNKVFCGFMVPRCEIDSDCPKLMKCCHTNKCGRKGCLLPWPTKSCGIFAWLLGRC